MTSGPTVSMEDVTPPAVKHNNDPKDNGRQDDTDEDTTATSNADGGLRTGNEAATNHQDINKADITGTRGENEQTTERTHQEDEQKNKAKTPDATRKDIGPHQRAITPVNDTGSSLSGTALLEACMRDRKRREQKQNKNDKQTPTERRACEIAADGAGGHRKAQDKQNDKPTGDEAEPWRQFWEPRSKSAAKEITRVKWQLTKTNRVRRQVRIYSRSRGRVPDGG